MAVEAPSPASAAAMCAPADVTIDDARPAVAHTDIWRELRERGRQLSNFEEVLEAGSQIMARGDNAPAGAMMRRHPTDLELLPLCRGVFHDVEPAAVEEVPRSIAVEAARAGWTPEK